MLGQKIQQRQSVLHRFWHKLTLTQQAQESWVNKYKLYLLFYSLFTQNMAILQNPLMQFIICDMQWLFQ
jgi:membrane protein YqaA with SNARE-associated domain